MSDATEAAPPRKQNRSSEELQMRALIEPALRARWPTARIIHELPMRYSTNRIDMAAVTAEDIVAVEIKSSRDVAGRLEAQLRAFAPIATRLIVALAPKWNPDLPPIRKDFANGHSLIPQYGPAQEAIRRVGADHTETWTVCAEAGTVTQASWPPARQRYPWPLAALGILHAAELQDIAVRHGAAPGKTHGSSLEECLAVMTTREALRAVCRALRARDAFSLGTDPPILDGAEPPRRTASGLFRKETLL